MTFGCNIPIAGPLATPQNLRTMATRAEELGFQHLWVSDHVIYPVRITSPYPYSPSGVPEVNPEETYCEPLSVLCHLAACTQHIMLGTHVLVLPYRNPVLTAKIISALDYISGGRVILGVGVGWMEEEFVALGQNTFSQRGSVTDEYIQIFKELWTKDDPEFQGRHYQASGFKFYPKPVQKPHPPIWVGGHTNAAMRRAAQLGDGWIPIGLKPPAQLEPNEMASRVRELRDMTEKYGRRRDAVEICFSAPLVFDPSPGAPRPTLAGSPEEIGADLVRYREAGVQHFVFTFAGDGLERMLQNMERFAEEVKPLVA